MYSTAIRPVHQSKATVETSRLHIGFACIRAHPEALEADFQCLSRISSRGFPAASLGGGAKTRERARCLAHRAGSRAVLGTCRGRSRSPGPSDRPYATPARRHRRGAPKTSRRSFEASLRLRATQQRAALPRVPPPRAPSLRTVFAAGVGDLTLFLLTWCGPGF